VLESRVQQRACYANNIMKVVVDLFFVLRLHAPIWWDYIIFCETFKTTLPESSRKSASNVFNLTTAHKFNFLVLENRMENVRYYVR